ncbi:hypothetical protein SEA_PUPPER_20 [Gordonia phage Pupper]|uniref:Uncharacterized protein n=1 Tax=Gordonia phage Pupper TaxID=2571249 RepID=A0A4Y6EKE4_9CAUD|nr:hypothetical protein KHQ83_gp020 [Gordonia phage Pupper]QDF18507.1 hypothetical protein SEA_PUPPER_20 [Gordonia phage Pupper]
MGDRDRHRYVDTPQIEADECYRCLGSESDPVHFTWHELLDMESGK